MAGRTPKPWYRESKKAWYVHIRGKTHRLGTDEESALRAFHRLMAEEGEPIRSEEPLTVGQLAEHYLADLKRRTEERTYYVANCYLKPFLKDCGSLQVSQLRKHHVEASVRSHGRWNPTTENHVKCRILAVFNWAVSQELLTANPIQGLRKPRARSRGVRTLIAPADHTKFLEAAPDYLKNVLTVLFQTGARPGEVLTVTAADFHPDRAVWLLQRHKTEHETGKPRVVFLTAEVVKLCQGLAEKHPTGPLFRTARGKVFPPAYYLARLVRGLCRKLGLRGVIPYGYRHTFATDALARGIADAQVAELLGHTGTAMLHRHYSHLTARQAALREALGRVRSTDQPTESPKNGDEIDPSGEAKTDKEK